MALAEVDIVVEDSSGSLGLEEELLDSIADDPIEGEVGAEEDDVALVDFGADEFELLVLLVLIESVVGVLVFVEERE